MLHSDTRRWPVLHSVQRQGTQPTYLCMSKAPEDFDASFWELCIHVLNLLVTTHLTVLQACDVHGHILLAQAADLNCSTTSNHTAGSQCFQYICRRAAASRQPAGCSDHRFDRLTDWIPAIIDHSTKPRALLNVPYWMKQAQMNTVGLHQNHTRVQSMKDDLLQQSPEQITAEATSTAAHSA